MTLFEEIRKKSGVSQQEVAMSMGLSLTAYRNKEKGRSRFFADELPKFSKATKTNAEDLINLIFLENSCQINDTSKKGG